MSTYKHRASVLIIALLSVGSSLVSAQVSEGSIRSYLEDRDYQHACLAIKEAGEAVADATQARSHPETEQEVEALRLGLFQAAQVSAAKLKRGDQANEREWSFASALGLYAANSDLLDVALSISKEMRGSPMSTGEAIGQNCMIAQSLQFKVRLVEQLSILYRRLAHD